MEKLTLNKNGQWNLSKGIVQKILDRINPPNVPSEGEDPNLKPHQQSYMLDSHPSKVGDVGTHLKLASNSSLDPGVARDLAYMHDGGSMVHFQLAKNPKTPGDALDHIHFALKNPKPDSEYVKPEGIDYYLAQHKNLPYASQKSLIDKYEPDSVIHSVLARKEDLHVDAQHKLLDMNDKGSYVHRQLAKNPNLHPSVKPKLGL